MAVPIYSVGTATLTAGSTAMVGQGTLWGGVRPYDMVIGQDGSVNLVLSVEDNTHITLLFNWGGATQTAQAYRILYTADDPFTQTLVRQVMQSLAASALVALGGLTAAARQGVYFDATATAALFDLSDAGRALLAAADADGQLSELGFSTFMKGIINDPDASTALSTLGFSAFAKTLIDDADASAALDTLGFSDFLKTLVNDADAATARGTLGLAAVAASGSASDLGSGTLPNARVSATLTADKAFRQGNILATVAQSAGVPTGGIIERGANVNGSYVRYADGTQVCWNTLNGTTVAGNINFAAVNYPAAFVAVPLSVTDKFSSLAARFSTSVGTTAPSATSITIGLGDNGAGGVSINVNYLSVGRWF
ncbi:hypothetical protein [Mesorhizobium sp. B2-4-8]|uniref:hypothetical protein n=1 Tax=Mesorhizobium sp. B2-4-8 TaxID=2589941 RepID=UPI00112C4304|nr:hypothetical protein [Mesorhizobium sp. B2-4-8]TPL39240.1 hypothetical protein FJ947_00060 [Mesorhizobium sp. B2-4-8]